MSKSKRCAICNTRPIGSGRGHDAAQARLMGYCNSCNTLAELENGHSDNGHQDAGAVVMGWATQEELDACWICHPELDATQESYVERSGTARTGMTLNVPLKAGPTEKAITVALKLAGSDAEAFWALKTAKARTAAIKSLGVKLTTTSGYVTMEFKGLKLMWDAQGRYVYSASNFGGKKVRNVAEALRIAAQA